MFAKCDRLSVWSEVAFGAFVSRCLWKQYNRIASPYRHHKAHLDLHRQSKAALGGLRTVIGML